MTKKNHPMLTGTLILTLTGLITRLMGFFYKIFLSRTIGAEGIGIYQMIFPIYGVCYAFTTSGLEISISRFVSGDTAKGRGRQSRRIMWTGLVISLSLALLTSLLLYTRADFIANRLLCEARCARLLRILALSVPFGACHSCICGYYYGLRKTGVPAAAQLLEQFVRVAAVFLLYRIAVSEGRSLTPETAVIGLVLGELASMLLGFFCIFSVRPGENADNQAVTPFRLLTRDMLLLSVPVSANRVCMNLLSSVEATLIPFALQQYGLSNENALSVYGTLTGMALAFIMFPSVLTNAVSVMLLPSVSQSQFSGDRGRLSRTVQKTIAWTLPLGAACTCFFLASGKALGLFFFKSSLAGDFIITLAWICPFLYLNGTLHSILNGLGRTAGAFANNLIGILIRIFFILMFVPHFGIQGYLWGILANQLFVCLLNVLALKEYLR